MPAFLVAMALRSVDAFRIFATPFVLTGVDGLPVLTSIAYHFAQDRNDIVAGNVAALTLAAALFLATTLMLAAATTFGRRGRHDR